MPVLMWIRIAAVVAVLVAGLYVKSVFDRAAEADALEKKVEEMALAAAKSDKAAVDLETELQDYRRQEKELNRKWSRIRADQNRNVCLLDEPTRSLLRSAGSGDAR